jgi:hypothetical protein
LRSEGKRFPICGQAGMAVSKKAIIINNLFIVCRFVRLKELIYDRFKELAI